MTRLRLSVAVLLVLAGCRDAVGPLDAPNALGHVVRSPTSSHGIHMLQQASTAPRLETYRVSFWAYQGKASTVTVNYQPTAGERVGQPFLRFDIPRHGLAAGAGGAPLKKGDSVLVTLTIDAVNFSVAFRPSGVLFSTKSPAKLTIWYENANPDLNGNGVVDGNDQQLQSQLAVWYQANPWSKLSSQNDTAELFVATALYHFSEYAVCW